MVLVYTKPRAMKTTLIIKNLVGNIDDQAL
jgi:hypothetical protein